MRLGHILSFILLTSGWRGAVAIQIDVPGDYGRIQDAIAAAAPGDRVVVQPGTYEEALDFLGKAITVTGSEPEDSTIVAATVVHPPSTTEDPLSAVTFASNEQLTSVLSGLTLTGGHGTTVFVGWNVSTGGGGVFCDHSSPQITHCIVRDNQAIGDWKGGWGGGIYCTYASPVITHCTFQGNWAHNAGGGFYATHSSPTVTDCAFQGNTADRVGGGIDSQYESNPTFINCIMTNNSARTGGCAAFDTGSPSFINCTVAGNSAESIAGGFHAYYCSLHLTNCSIADNSAEFYGGIEAFHSSLYLTNCTLANNVAGTGGGIHCQDLTTAAITNCILWNNVPDQVEGGASVTITYSDIEGGWRGEGNIDAAPRFVSLRGFDYLLHPESPCIDAGDPTVEDGIYDQHPRWPDRYPNGRRADMGAYGGPCNGGWVGLECR